MASATSDAWTLYISFVLEEYRMLRAEIKQRQANMIAIITATVAANGVLFTLGVDIAGLVEDPTLYGQLYFTYALPGINLIMMYVFVFEVIQMVQFGNYVLYLEMKLNYAHAAAGGAYEQNLDSLLRETEAVFQLDSSRVPLFPPMVWEHWLRVMRARAGKLSLTLSGHLWWLYPLRMFIFVLLSLAASCVSWLIYGWNWQLLIPYCLGLLPFLPLVPIIAKGYRGGELPDPWSVARRSEDNETSHAPA